MAAMNVIGISGLERAVPFKKQNWPGLEEREYRISQGHDAAAALVVNGVPVAAAAEERFDRRKHSARFPTQAIAFCLNQAGLRERDIDEIAHGFDYEPFRGIYSVHEATSRMYREVCSRDVLLEQVRRDMPGFSPERVHSVSHHLAHAASAYYTSGWNDCLAVVVDAMGEVHGASVYRGRDGRLERLAAMSALDSIGILYSLITLHLGFDFNSDEYKIMGLAPYGDPDRCRAIFDQMVQLRPDGGISIPILRRNTARKERETYAGTRAEFERLLLPPRRPDAEITGAHRDVAAALQECLDRVMLHICGTFARRTGLRRLALAGGVALNCTANGRLIKSGLFDEVYVQPAAGDDGSALGAALYRSALAGEIHNQRMPVPFLGPEHGVASIDQALSAFSGRLAVYSCRHLRQACDAAAALIAGGYVIAWYRGRMEFGPRALGHRSILADPSHPEMRNRINVMVKMREAFRPFAPAVTLDQASRWFDVPPGAEHPYMITTVDVREQFRRELPAVTHVNGSARIQTVSARDNGDFYTLLKSVGKATGKEIVLNTSFNVKGQPIVNTPVEAIETFAGTGIEFLFLENTLVTRKETFTAAARLLEQHAGASV